jgi:hypothetical protein
VQHGLEAKIAEVMCHFVQGLDLTRHKFETQIKEVEAQAAQGIGSSTATTAGRVDTPKFNGSTTWAVPPPV